MSTAILEKPSEFFRTAPAIGIKASEVSKIDREGGKYKAGLIPGFSVISKGEALGHDLWIDEVFLSQVADAINTLKTGSKSRFTHPGLSGDGLGKATGRVYNARVEGDRVFADLHLSNTAHKSPDGDLAGYLLDFAEEDPEAFGASISFRHDMEAEEEFVDENRDGEGRFVSPDPGNVHNFEHARLRKLRAVDFVDSPAANPSGLFHTGIFEVLEGGEAVLDFLFGVTDQPPAAAMGIDPSRLKGFAARWAADRGFSVHKESQMASNAPAAPADTSKTEVPAAELSAGTATPPPAAAPQSSAPPATPPATEASAAPAAPPATPKVELTGESAPAATPKPAEQPVADTAKALGDAKTTGFNDAKDQVGKYVDLFGAENGVKWFREGKPLDECRDLHAKSLEAANKDLKSKLDAATTGLGEDAPLSGTPGGKAELPSKYLLNCGRNLGQVAQTIDAQAAKLGFTKPSNN